MSNQLMHLIVLSLSIIVMADVDIDGNLTPFRAEVQSCRGCQLNRLPEVKAFIYNDVPKYAGVTFKPIPGANPDLVLFNSQDTFIRPCRTNLTKYKRIISYIMQSRHCDDGHPVRKHALHNEIKRIDLKPYSKKQCNDLLESYGYTLKESIDEFTGQKHEL